MSPKAARRCEECGRRALFTEVNGGRKVADKKHTLCKRHYQVYLEKYVRAEKRGRNGL